MALNGTRAPVYRRSRDDNQYLNRPRNNNNNVGGASDQGELNNYRGSKTDLSMDRNRSRSDIGSMKAASVESVNGGYDVQSVEDDTVMLEREKLLVEEMGEIWKIAVPIDEARLTERVVRLKTLLHLNTITKGVFRKFRVRVLDDAIVFPRFSHMESLEGPNLRLTGAKLYRLGDPGGGLSAVSEEILPSANVYNGLFGYNLVTPGHKEAVVVGREADAMAVYQATKQIMSTLTLPDSSGPLSYDALPYLEDFSKITLWFPSVQYSRAKQFARRLGPQRCFIVSPKISSLAPADLLVSSNITLAYDKIVKIVGVAEAVLMKDIETFASLRESAKDHVFGTGQVTGVVQWKRFPLLNHFMRGFRLGELTILTGPTGCGKTTFLSEYSLDLCEQNINTLWCSFEIPNSRLVSIMVCQYAKKEFINTNSGEFDFWYDKLMQLPMYFAKFDVATPVKRVIEAIEHHITMHDIQHVVIDNLHFMMESTASKNSADRFKYQEEICGLFRKVASQKNVHVTMVVHPNSDAEDNGVTMNSLYGGLKASQEADNVFIIQRKYFRSKETYFEKFLQIWKNRYVGEVLLGERLQMFFDPKSKCHRLVMRSKKTSSRE